MSVWKKIESKVMDKNVSKETLAKALEKRNITLDDSIKTISNAFGSDTCDAALINKANPSRVSMGVRFNKNGGVELVGDIWGTGLGKDKGQEELLDRIAHHYQVENITEQLSMSNWCIESTVTENGKTVMDIVQY